MTWGDAMKDIKEKPTAHMPRSNATGAARRIPAYVANRACRTGG